MLSSKVVSRSFPVFTKWFTPAAIDILKKVSVDGYIPFNESDEGINICYRMGWIQRTPVTNEREIVATEVGVLPSRLHEKLVILDIILVYSSSFWLTSNQIYRIPI